MKIASANGVTKILITTWTNKFLFGTTTESKEGQRHDSCKREKNIGSGEKKITGERLRKVAKNRWNSIQDACDRLLPSLQKKCNRVEALAHLLAAIRWWQPTCRESGNDRQPP
jgi:hypothetical protein